MKEVWLLTVIIKNDVSRVGLLTYIMYDVIKPSKLLFFVANF